MTTEPIGKIEDSALTAAVEAMEALIAQQDWEGASRYLTDDVLYKVAHRPPATGIGGIRDYMAWQYSLVHWDGHDVRMKFSRGNTVVIEVDSREY